MFQQTRMSPPLPNPQTYTYQPINLNLSSFINSFIGSDGNPITNMQAYGTLFDYVTLMAYDAYGPGSDTTGPNAPLDICTGGNGGAVQAVNNWVNAQFPKCKILLVSFYFLSSLPSCLFVCLDEELIDWICLFLL